MKLRITITGPKVHDVGYRDLLLGGAMGLCLPGFDANNLTDGENHVVEIAVDGKESQIEAFREYVETNRPSGAEVSNIGVSDYDDDVMRMAEYSQILTALLVLKAIPTILKIRDSTRVSFYQPSQARLARGRACQTAHSMGTLCPVSSCFFSESRKNWPAHNWDYKAVTVRP